jgi:hypothetical protein
MNSVRVGNEYWLKPDLRPATRFRPWWAKKIKIFSPENSIPLWVEYSEFC